MEFTKHFNGYAMTFEAALIATVMALCGCIVFLFGFFMRRQDKLHADTLKLHRSQSEADRDDFNVRLMDAADKWDDAVARIRILEDARVTDERKHGQELKALAGEVLKEAAANREAHRQIAEENRVCMRELIHAINCRSCESQSPQDLALIETDAITKSHREHA